MNFDLKSINGSLLRSSPDVLRGVVNKMLAEASPKKVARTLKQEFGIGRNFVAKRTGVNLDNLRVEAAKPPIKKGAKPVVKKPTGPTEKPIPSLEVLQAKYDKFDEHWRIYDQAIKSLFYLGHTMHAAEFRDTGGYSQGQFNDFEAWNARTNRAPIGNVNKSEHGRYMRVRPEYIETIVDLTEGRSKFDVPTVSFGYINSTFANSQRQKAARIVQSYFPDFKLPTEWHTVEVDHEYIADRKIKAVKVKMPDSTVELSLEKFSGIHPTYTHANDQLNRDTKWGGDNWVAMPTGYAKKGFSQLASLRLTLEGSQATMTGDHAASSTGLESGLLTDVSSSVRVVVPIKAELVIRWPIEFACYATSSRSRKEFIPFLFYQYISYHRVAYGGERNKPSKSNPEGSFTIKAPSRVNHLGSILEMIEEEKKMGRAPKPRVNEDDFLIMGSAEPSMMGDVLWIPRDANRVPDYVAQIKNTYSPETERIDFKSFNLKGQALFTDWFSEKFSYVRESGIGSATDAADASGIQTYDLLGAIPLDFTTINRDLNVFLREDQNRVKALIGLITKFMSGETGVTPSQDYLSQNNLLGIPDLSRMARHYTDFNKVILSLADSSVGVTWANLGGKPLAPDEPEKYKVERALCKIVREVMEDMARNFETLNLSYQTRMSMRYYFWLVTKYSNKHAEYNQLAATKEAKNRIGSEDLPDVERNKLYGDVSKVLVPNLPGLEKMMPHQVETANVTNAEPESVFLDIHMGGGKTLIGTLEALNLIHKEKIKRALFIVPNNLVRSWINEINSYSQGEVNPFAITLKTMRRLQLAMGGEERPLDYKLLERMVKSCPTNTLFITSYNFLRSDVEDIVYANKNIERLVAAEYLRDIGFDAVFLDESHKAKNPGTQQTKGTTILASAAKFVRLMSGTIVNNTLSDLVGQAAMANPAAYGRMEHFNERYGSGGKGTVTVWQPTAEQDIVNDGKPYLQRITHKRQRWAFTLPKLIEQFHPVSFTEAQAKFYNDALEEQLDKLLEDPKIQKLLRGNEGDQAALMAALSGNAEFSKLEEFVYAPDQNLAFMSQEGLKPEDAISPKVPMLIKLLDKHFAGYKDTRSDIEFDPSAHKVLVFSRRKPASIHIFEHLPDNYKKMAVHYTAGDLQALESFLKNPKIKILVADETSINTGQNFQIASRLIRMETLWTPGDQDQALARIWRPDLKKGTVPRTHVFSDWVFTNGSLEVAKIGRIVSKIVNKMKYDWSEFTQFRKTPYDVPPRIKERLRRMPEFATIDQKLPVADQLPQLQVITVGLEQLKSLRNWQQIEGYFGAFSLISNWENHEFDRQKDMPWAKMVSVPETSRVAMKGAKKLAWVPRPEGVDPEKIDPTNQFGYKPISVLESDLAVDASENKGKADDDEDSDNVATVQVNACAVGDLVDTEFGFGIIKKVMANPKSPDIWVEIKGLPAGVVKVQKATAWLVTNPRAASMIKAKMRTAGAKGMARLPGVVASNPLEGMKPAKPEAPKPPRDAASPKGGGGGGRTPIIRPPQTRDKLGSKKNANITDDDRQIDVYAEIVDGQIALTLFAEDNDSEELISDFDFKPIAPYYAVRVRNSIALSKVLNLLKSKFEIKQALVDNFQAYIGMMKDKRLGQHDPAQFAETARFFNITNHKQAGDNEIRPFPIVWGGKMFIAVDKEKTKAAAKFLRVVRSAAIPGTEVKELQEGVHLRLFKSKQAAIKAVHEINEQVKIDPDTLKSTLAFLHALRSTKVVEPPPVRNTKKPAPKATQVKVAPKKAPPKPAPKKAPVPTPTRKGAAPKSAPVIRPKMPKGRGIVDDSYDEDVEITPRRATPKAKPSTKPFKKTAPKRR